MNASLQIPVRDLWLPLSRLGFEGDVFMVIVGYMDESYSMERPPLTFGLSCLFAYGNEWSWIEMAWKKLIDDKNCELISQGRKPLKRTHAVDMSNFVDDFEGWSSDERISFTEKCNRVLGRHTIRQLGYTMSLQDVAEIWGGDHYFHFAYFVALKFMMLQTRACLESYFGHVEAVTLIHENSDYDIALLSSFNATKGDPSFKDSDLFTTIAPMCWQKCTPLQPADFVAYEMMKEAHRREPKVIEVKKRERRKSLTGLLEENDFAATSFHIPRKVIKDLRDSINASAEAILRSGE